MVRVIMPVTRELLEARRRVRRAAGARAAAAAQPAAEAAESRV
jgi:hypothetical protein